ncbi:SPFH domain-containing protein [Psychrobacter lutiphocae]|uniref:SPFH domain-containing protein n=1 Tax=Psychrobacter lutiphocae TaxID=540500 RepID=UPI00036DEEF0|nr:SPFH domain-containing protein [Psychrobacter lutiphocae]
MGLRNFIKKQFIDVIEWDWQDDNLLMWKFPMADNEIQNGASLTVRDGQVAVFINEGQIADVFGAGSYTLTTQTLPLMTNLKNWRMGFDSPFKSDVLFFSTRLQQGRKWGTTQPVTVRDAEFGMVRLRAFGMYSYKINDVAQFYQSITGINEHYHAEQIEPQLRNLIVSNLASGLGQSEVAFIDLAANQGLMADEVKKSLQLDFANYGLELTSFVVENVSLPETLQQTLDKRISMGMIGDMDAYTRFQTAEAIQHAAKNEGGMAGVGAGLGVGMNMGQVMSEAMASGQPQAQTAQPQAQQQQPQPAATESATDFTAKLSQLKGLLDQGLISQADYDEAKTKILTQLTQ